MSLRCLAGERRQQIFLIGIIAVSILVRVAAAVYLGNQVVELPGTADQQTYHTLALRVLGGHGFSFGEPWWPATPAGAPTAHWSYLYTIFLATVYGLFGPSPLVARILQAIVVGFIHPYLIYCIGRKIFNPVVGLVGATLTAGYTYFIYYAAALMTEAFYISALLGVIYLALRMVGDEALGATYTKKRTLILGVGLGLSLGVTVLLRQLMFVLIPIIFLWIWGANRNKSMMRSTLISLVIATSLMMAMVLPFTIYNYSRFGQFVLLNTNVGFTFFWANHPIYGTKFQPILEPGTGTYGELIPSELSNLDEAQLDKELLKRGIQFVREDPGRYVLLSVSRIPIYFMFWPSNSSPSISNLMRVVSFGLMWPFMLYGLAAALKGCWPKSRGLTSPISLLIIFVMVYAGIHLLSWSLIRYRLPIDSVMLIFAGLGMVDLVVKARRGRMLMTERSGQTENAHTLKG